MAWVDISDTKVDYKDTYGSKPSGTAAVCLQYNEDSATAEEVTVRFKYYRTDGSSGNLFDCMYILYNANDSVSTIGNLRRTLFKLKDYTSNTTAKWPYYSESFTIKKNYNSGTFSLQDYWICNDGAYNTTASATAIYNKYKDGGGRATLSCKVESENITIAASLTVAAPVTANTPTISDLYTGLNTSYYGSCRITAKAGTAGGANKVNSTTLQYKIGGGNWTKATGLSIDPIKLTAAGDSNTQTVYARTIVEGVYNSDTSKEASLDVRRYVAPNAPGKPALTKDSYKNSRLTVKQNWTYEWVAATPGTGTGTTNGTGTNQTTSRVTGYRAQLYRKRPTESSFSSIPIKSGSNTLSTASGSEHFYDIRTNSLTINPIDCDIEPGDQVKLGIRPYTQYGVQNDGSKLFRTVTTESDASTVQNAGVMRVKPNNTVGWKEGVVWVKVNKGTATNPDIKWVEADVVQVKTSAGWKESI